MWREHDDDFFPDHAALHVVDIVDFIKYNPLDVANEIGAFVQHASQNFSLPVLRKSAEMQTPPTGGGKEWLTVMMRHDASGLICTSPVKMPTFSAPKVCLKSLNF